MTKKFEVLITDYNEVIYSYTIEAIDIFRAENEAVRIHRNNGRNVMYIRTTTIL